MRAVLFSLLAIVAGAAAVLSFAALHELAVLCGFTPALATLLPVTVDAGAAAGSLVWVGAWAPAAARSFARTLALVLLGGSVAGNALSHGLAAYSAVPAWWTVVLVSAVPPAVLGAVVHLAVLVGRGAGVKGGPRARHDEPNVQVKASTVRADLPKQSDDLEARARQLVATGAGRGTLARELNLSEYEARTLVEKVRTNGVAR